MAKRQAKSKRLNVQDGGSSLVGTAPLLNELRGLIAGTRLRVASVVNTALVTLYWEVGNVIRTDVLKSG